MENSAAEVVSSSPLINDRNQFRAIGNPYESYQAKRRRAALLRQKAARLQSSGRARNLALDNQEDGVDESPSRMGDDSTTDYPREADTDLGMEPSTSYDMVDEAASERGSGRRHQRQQQHGQARGSGGVRAYGQRYGNELMQPEWMTDVPRDLAEHWLVMPRPEGMRCLLVASRGRTVSWLRNGAPLHRFHSPLPGGSPASSAGCGKSAAAAATAGDYCLLDCIFHPPNNTYYVQDLLCWRGFALYDTAAEFRLFWLVNKFQEEDLMPTPKSAAAVEAQLAAGATAPPAALGAAARSADRAQPGSECINDLDTDMAGDAAGREVAAGGSRAAQRQHEQQPPVSYRIVPLPVRPCTLQGLRAAYGRVPPPPAASGVTADMTADPWVAAGADATMEADSASAGSADGRAADDCSPDIDFLRDGLYFLHRQGHYCPGPCTSPLALLWKDLGCSRYLIDTDAKGQPLEHQTVVLTYRADRTVATEDEPPVVLGRLPEAFVTGMGAKLNPGRLLKFSIRQGGITFHEGRPAGADLHYEGPANQRRGRADSFSKILFQRLARTAPITAAALAAAVAAAPPPQADAAAAGLQALPVWGGRVGAAVPGGDMVVE